MDQSAVEAIAIRHLPRLAMQLGLHQWEISLGYDPQPAVLATVDMVGS
jgi:hypothetical protein